MLNYMWYSTDPNSLSPSKALESIGHALQLQYERWQPRARYKQSLDPTSDEVTAWNPPHIQRNNNFTLAIRNLKNCARGSDRYRVDQKPN